MMLLQLSAGQGPEECCRAVALAIDYLQKQCKSAKVKLEIVDVVKTKQQGYKSVLLQLSGDNTQQLANEWSGSMLWISQSPFRAKNRRKNWFFRGAVFEINEKEVDKSISFQACRASGAGGQHVNTTDSAIRATHVETGVSVRVESERSQHANKRLARALIFQKLEEHKQSTMSLQEKQRWMQHKELERGNPVKTFKGDRFEIV